MNRTKFEQRLVGNLKRRLRPLGSYCIFQKQSQLWIEPADPLAPIDIEALLQAVTSVFGIVLGQPGLACNRRTARAARRRPRPSCPNIWANQGAAAFQGRMPARQQAVSTDLAGNQRRNRWLT